MNAELPSSVLRWLIEASWQVCVLVALVLVAQAAFGRVLTPRWRYGLWLLVVARLVVPWSPVVEGGLLRWDVESFSRPFPAWIDAPLLTGGAAAAAAIDEPSPRAEERGAATRTGSTLAGSTAATAPSATTAPPERRAVDALSLAVLVWAAVALILLARGAIRETLFRRRLARARTVDDPDLLALVEASRRHVGVRRRVTVLESELVQSPAVCGLLRPRLLLPPGLARTLTPDDLRPVLLHELLHVRRGDVPANLILSLLGALYWFHPLVHLAIARVRATRESVRDWEALAVAPAVPSRRYAETLLELVQTRSNGSPAPAVGFGPRGRDLKRRILMIAAFDRLSKRKPLAAVTGAVLVAGLGWVTFTQAAPSAVLDPVHAPASSGGDLKRIAVEREVAPPPWRAEMERALDTEISVEFQSSTLDDAFAFLRSATGLNFIVEPNAIDVLGDPELTLGAPRMRVRELLHSMCDILLPELGFALTEGIVVVGLQDELPTSMDLRLYRLDPFLVDVAPERQDSKVDEIMMLTRDHTTDGEEWDRVGVSMEFWNGLLVVVQTDEVHAETRAFLELLLNRGMRPAAAPPAWRTELDARLSKKVSVSFEDEPIGGAAYRLTLEHGILIMIRDEVYDEITLELADVPLRTVLEWLARRVGLRVGLENGAVVFTESVRPTLEIYEIGDLVRPWREGDEEDYRDHLCDMLRDNVDPESWDVDPRYSIVAWEDLLLVRQSEDGHARIRSMFAALRRAKGEEAGGR